MLSFCSFYPSNIVNDQSNNIEIQATAPKSIQVTVDYIQDAYINNISFQSKGNRFNVIIYKTSISSLVYGKQRRTASSRHSNSKGYD